MITASHRHRLFIALALAAVCAGILFGYRHRFKSEDGAWGLGSLLAGLLVIYLVWTWQADAKSLLYKRGLLVNPGLLFVFWGAGMLCKVHRAPEFASDVLVVGSLVAAVGGLIMLIVGERRRGRKETTSGELYRIRSVLLLVNFFTLIVAGVCGALAMTLAWDSWRLAGRRELAVYAVGGLALLVAGWARWRGVKWVWLAANVAVVPIGFYASFAKDQQLVEAVGFRPFSWIAYVVLPVTMGLLVQMFKRIDADFRWVRDPSLLGPK